MAPFVQVFGRQPHQRVTSISITGVQKPPQERSFGSRQAPRCDPRSTAVGGETCDSALVPFEAEARPLCCNSSVDGAVWLCEYGAGDIEILKPMGGRGDGEQMRAGLDKNMA